MFFYCYVVCYNMLWPFCCCACDVFSLMVYLLSVISIWCALIAKQLLLFTILLTALVTIWLKYIWYCGLMLGVYKKLCTDNIYYVYHITILSDSSTTDDCLSILLLLLCEQSCGLTVLLRSIIIVVAGSSSTTTTTTERDDWIEKINDERIAFPP